MAISILQTSKEFIWILEHALDVIDFVILTVTQRCIRLETAKIPNEGAASTSVF